MGIFYPEGDLPVLWSGDALVLGASLAGIAAALELADAGKNTALVEPRTYPARDLFAVLRPWLKKTRGYGVESLPGLAQEMVRVSGKFHESGEYPLHPDLVKLLLEDLLLQANVKLLYASQVVGILAEAGCVRGVIVGNKSGRQALSCQLALDVTETALATRLAGGEFEPWDEQIPFSSTLEFDQGGAFRHPILPVSATLGLVGDQVRLHKGHRGRGHILVEFATLQAGLVSNALEHTRREYAIRQKAFELAVYLRKNVPIFNEAVLATLAQEAFGAQATRQAGPAASWAEILKSKQVKAAYSGLEFEASLADFSGPQEGLWCLNEAARLDEEQGKLVNDPAWGCAVGKSLGKQLATHWEACTGKLTDPEVRTEKLSPEPSATEVEIREPGYPQKGRKFAQVLAKAISIPVLCDLEVLVVGGGSSGAVAGITAAHMGAQAGLVDMNPGLGGTATYGGVDSYWCGYRGGVVPQVVGWVNQLNDELGFPHMKGLVPKWKPEVKTQALLHQAMQAGVKLVLGTKVIAAIVEGKTVRGVVAATSLGPAAILGKVVIDATGDGDVAAYAGAEYLYGSQRDHSTMWYALHMLTKPGVTRNAFTSTVDIRNIEDYTRAILSGRRRGNKGKDHDHTTYIAPRETRHILGDVVLELNDHLLRRSWRDAVYIAFSNNDIKGQISSDWMRMGLIPPHLEIEIPYGALLPRGLEGILVTGKAISTTHDSLAAVRMQADMENLGAATAMAAVQAVRSECTPRQVEIRRLQEALVQMNLLPEAILSRELKLVQFNEGELETLIASIDADQPLYEFSDMRLDQVYRERISIVDVVTAGPEAIPLLERDMEMSRGKRRVLMAQMLAMMGAKTATPVLIEELDRQLSSGKLPGREHAVLHAVKFAPDQAAMPLAANLLYSLGMARDPKALVTWQKVVDLLRNTTEEAICSQETCTFHYVDAICVGAEQLGDPDAAPILKQLHNYPIFHGQALLSGFQADFLKERQAYLEVVIGRALARCGDPEGVVTLINYLGDRRALLAEQAQDELAAITGEDFGKDVKAWSDWLEANAEGLKPVPWNLPTEAQRAWGQRVETTVMDDPHRAFGREQKEYRTF